MDAVESFSALALTAALAAAPSVQAAIVTVTGDTAGKPTFTRPVEDLSALSSVGVGVRYDAFGFTVGAAGSYTFLTTGAFDTFSLLYGPTFSAASPLSNALVADDDIAGVVTMPSTTSGFAYALAAGTVYTLVTTGFAPSDFGAYSVTIGGPGAVTATVPEPQALLLMAAGLGLVCALRGRRTR